MASSDLFVWLNALWTKMPVEGTFPVYVAHRFLASDRDMANVARVLRRDLRDADLIFSAWQGILPSGGGAPRMSYPAAKKLPAAEELTQRMMTVRKVRREVAEAEQDVVAMVGRLLELYLEYGVEPTEELREAGVTVARGRLIGAERTEIKKKVMDGLLGHLE